MIGNYKHLWKVAFPVTLKPLLCNVCHSLHNCWCIRLQYIIWSRNHLTPGSTYQKASFLKKGLCFTIQATWPGLRKEDHPRTYAIGSPINPLVICISNFLAYADIILSIGFLLWKKCALPWKKLEATILSDERKCNGTRGSILRAIGTHHSQDLQKSSTHNAKLEASLDYQRIW